MITVGSLFSGIGGLELGLERSGMEIKWQVEIDPFCQKVLAKHWPGVKRYGDIKTLTGHELESVDLICGGFPCQPVSVAGRRAAQQDERWLWPEFSRLIGVLRPRYVLVENVPGLLSANQGSAFGEVLSDLVALGYDAEWQCLPAAAFGAPHLRYRTFLVAYTKQQGLERQEFIWDGICSKPSTSPTKFGNEIVHCWTNWGDLSEYLRMGNGVPGRLDKDRIKSLGNAVVPQVAEYIGRCIINGS